MDVLLLSPGKHMFDEAFSLSGLGVGHKYFAHSVGYFWLLPRCAFSLSVKSWKEARAKLKLVLLSREKKKRNKKGEDIHHGTYCLLGGTGGGGGSRRDPVWWFCMFLFFSRLIALKSSSNPRAPTETKPSTIL